MVAGASWEEVYKFMWQIILVLDQGWHIYLKINNYKSNNLVEEDKSFEFKEMILLVIPLLQKPYSSSHIWKQQPPEVSKSLDIGT